MLHQADAPTSSSPGRSPAEPRVSRWLVVPLFLLLIGAVAVLGWLILDDEGRAVPAAPEPKRWDPRVEPFVAVVEEERGLTFSGPVDVRFLPEDEFVETVRQDEEEITHQDREKAEDFLGMMRALGLLHGEHDLFDAFGDAAGGMTLAYYSFDDRRITVRGTKVTAAMKTTIVHELTHALQDQHFDIGERLEKLSEAEGDGVDDSAYSVLHAVIEGDARRVENLYRDSLSERERRELTRGQAEDSERAEAMTEEVPAVLTTMMTSPYLLGQGLVDAVAAAGGNDAVDELLQETPERDDVLVEPLAHLSGDGGSEEVAAPPLPAGADELAEGSFGAVWWYVMLAERMSEREALAAVDGWGGDAMTAFESEGRSCVSLAVRGDTMTDTRRLARAARVWATAVPGHPSSVSVDDEVVLLESCDPGSEVRTGRDGSATAVQLLAVRTSLGTQLVSADVPVDVARCIAGSIVDEYTTDQLTDPTFGVGDPVVQQRVAVLAAACR